jgi:indole-3-acetate monooxygenase
MGSDGVAGIDSLDTALEAVARVASVARQFAQKAEEARALPVEVVDAFDEAGLWGATSPREVGGGGLGNLVDQYEISRSITYEDSSAGWAWFICGSTGMLLGSRLPPEGRLEVFRDRVPPIAGVFMPGGQGRPVDGGLFVNSGRWPFGSGIAHSPWVMANVLLVDEAGAPTPGPYGPIDVRSIVVPRDDVTIVDDWHVAGLRGTGSMSFTMDGITVPDRRTFHFFGPASIDEPRYRLPLFSLVGAPFAGVAIGLAQRALDEVISVLPTRARPPTFRPESESPAAQLALGRALAAVRAAHDSTRAVFGRYDSRSGAGEDLAQLPMAGRAEIHQQIVWAAETCVGAVNDVFRLGGASAIYEPGVLQRCWRDANVMLQHAYMTPTMHEISARVALGQEVDAFNV